MYTGYGSVFANMSLVAIFFANLFIRNLTERDTLYEKFKIKVLEAQATN